MSSVSSKCGAASCSEKTKPVAKQTVIEVRKECSNIVLRKADGVSHVTYTQKESEAAGAMGRHSSGRVYSVSFHREKANAKMDIALDAHMSYVMSLRLRNTESSPATGGGRRRVPLNAW